MSVKPYALASSPTRFASLHPPIQRRLQLSIDPQNQELPRLATVPLQCGFERAIHIFKLTTRVSHPARIQPAPFFSALSIPPLAPIFFPQCLEWGAWSVGRGVQGGGCQGEGSYPLFLILLLFFGVRVHCTFFSPFLKQEQSHLNQSPFFIR